MSDIEQTRLSARKVYGESLLRLDQAFITPLDREDILGLINEMYGVVDRVAELSQRLRLYQLKDLHPTLTGQAKNLSTIAGELNRIIHGLRHQKKLKDLKPGSDGVSGAMELSYWYSDQNGREGANRCSFAELLPGFTTRFFTERGDERLESALIPTPPQSLTSPP
ncbi:hypothetical protein JAO29_02645 [Edaphobacter sp. HDX4]|uniref:DUF47 domain-containing protein n=1 Tax=Edaphobacter sp. HDX4 TaxID=2794064 RepID=UPI002FE52ED5